PLRADDLEPAVRALEPVDRFVVVEMHAGVLREERDDLAALLVERPPKEPWAPHEPVRLEPAVSKGLGQLVPDERSTQDHRDLRLGDPGDHALRFIEVLEIEDIRRRLRSWRAEGIRTAACRDEEAVVR